MTCASCVAHVEEALRELPGVSNVVVNLATSKASLAYDPQRVKLEDMRRAADLGSKDAQVYLTQGTAYW